MRGMTVADEKYLTLLKQYIKLTFLHRRLESIAALNVADVEYVYA